MITRRSFVLLLFLARPARVVNPISLRRCGSGVKQLFVNTTCRGKCTFVLFTYLLFFYEGPPAVPYTVHTFLKTTFLATTETQVYYPDTMVDRNDCKKKSCGGKAVLVRGKGEYMKPRNKSQV